jgi:YggT family protein
MVGHTVVGTVLYYVLLVFLLLLIVRGVMSWVLALSRYRPAGPVAALLEVAYSATDPVIRPLDRLLPPIRLGRTALSLSYPIVWITTIVLMQVVQRL